MIGQHPQMYGLPEMHLFGAETMIERKPLRCQATVNINDGILRAVAQLCFGEQTEKTVKLAHGWLRRRADFTTGFLLEVLAQKVHPRVFVEKSPSTVRRIEFMERAHEMFPQARFLHLVRHPRGHGESLVNWHARRRRAVRPASQDLVVNFDPQRTWYALNVNICEFLKSVPDDQKMRVRGEDLLTAPDRWLREVASWLGLRTDAQAIEEMKHPERSPYASLGPAGARYGDDRFFIESPALRPEKGKPLSLDGPLSWRADGKGFLPRVRRLAVEFGYE
jgi:hypothetical protein